MPWSVTTSRRIAKNLLTTRKDIDPEAFSLNGSVYNASFFRGEGGFTKERDHD